jgi:hypothetical protein
MNKEPTEFQYLKAWLLFFVIATSGAWLITLVIGSFAAAFLHAGGGSLEQATRLIPVSYITFRGVVGKYLMPKVIWED